jgi:hypothetical protein
VYHELLPTVLRTADEIHVLKTAQKPSAEQSKIEELFQRQQEVSKHESN